MCNQTKLQSQSKSHASTVMPPMFAPWSRWRVFGKPKRPCILLSSRNYLFLQNNSSLSLVPMSVWASYISAHFCVPIAFFFNSWYAFFPAHQKMEIIQTNTTKPSRTKDNWLSVNRLLAFFKLTLRIYSFPKTLWPGCRQLIFFASLLVRQVYDNSLVAVRIVLTIIFFVFCKDGATSDIIQKVIHGLCTRLKKLDLNWQ